LKNYLLSPINWCSVCEKTSSSNTSALKKQQQREYSEPVLDLDDIDQAPPTRYQKTVRLTHPKKFELNLNGISSPRGISINAALDNGSLTFDKLRKGDTKWKIKARVTYKSEVFTFGKGINQSQFFYVDLMDANGAEMRGT